MRYKNLITSRYITFTNNEVNLNFKNKCMTADPKSTKNKVRMYKKYHKTQFFEEVIIKTVCVGEIMTSFSPEFQEKSKKQLSSHEKTILQDLFSKACCISFFLAECA